MTVWTNIIDGAATTVGATTGPQGPQGERGEQGLPGTVTLADLSGHVAVATGATTEATMAARFGDRLNALRDFGAAGDGVADDTTKIQAAINTGKPVYLPTGTYIVSGLTLLTGTILFGDGMTKTVIKLKNSANANVIAGSNTSDTYLADLKVDGNKSNQTDGLSLRGVYYSGGGERQSAHRIWVYNCKDHGYMHSDSTGDYGQITQCRFTDCGSTAHSSAGGPGGTGCAAGGTGVRIIRCEASGNKLNGFKAAGAYHENCIAASNGSGYETGFVAGDIYHTTYVHCHAWGNNGAMNHQGQGDAITILGGSFEDNALSGVRFVGSVARARVIGARFRNNGGNGGSIGTRTTDSIGPDAIGIYTNAGSPDGIIIDECEFIIDDGYSTADRYAIYAENAPGVVHIGERNQSTGYAEAVYITDYDRDVTFRGFPGVSGHYTLPAAYAHTGTTSTTDLASRQVKFHELLGRKLRLTAHGTVSGTAGTKLVRVAFGGSSVVVVNEAAGDQQRFSIEADITSTSIPDVRAVITACEDGGTSGVFFLRVAPGSVDVTFSINCTLGSAADTVTLNEFRLRTVE